MVMLKPLLLLLAWFAGGALAVFALAMVFAPYFVSVIANIGRRPVVVRSAKGNAVAVR